MRAIEREWANCDWQGGSKENCARRNHARTRLGPDFRWVVEDVALPFRAFDGRLERFRVARRAFSWARAMRNPEGVDGAATLAGEGAAFKPDGDDAPSSRASARFASLRAFVVKQN